MLQKKEIVFFLILPPVLRSDEPTEKEGGFQAIYTMHHHQWHFLHSACVIVVSIYFVIYNQRDGLLKA